MSAKKREADPKHMLEELLSSYDPKNTPRTWKFLQDVKGTIDAGNELSLTDVTTLEFLYEQL